MDRAVQRTDHDAIASKLSAVKRGYYEDEYLELFCPRFEPRLPLINIGTWCRVRAIDQAITEFLEKNTEGKTQVISLGAGSDTRPFHLLPKHPNLVYYEIDFPTQVRKKAAIVRRHLSQKVELCDSATPVTLEGDINTSRYHLLGQDLRQLSLPDLDESVPTLIISECCLCYLAPESSHLVLEYFASRVAHLSIVLYEPIGLDDEFGRVMAENLMMRGLCLPTFQKFSTLDSQTSRLRELGLTHTISAKDMEQYYNDLPSAEQKRIHRLEFLDEVEEMNLLLRHYCVVFAGK
ncbi:Leucine carboxyl methyltransferase 1 [Wickerhamiella sorbophila]|uniref:Leucine carboxyl methyltransferase 1 n=1 Tax=Wickerhamiella sorbophila TaxID=45607 RepID=A0A2T0FEQ5_9ASCO|nr:Leucine carboxyl methyltransferase 1 [Wickerhamiella sorbophila]PRT53482.1 Leucine carboxyl methyltransferase 1 [Wickerhamiella sorbophila]